MPHIRIVTNLPRENFDQDFLDSMVKEMAIANGKPDKVIKIVVVPNYYVSVIF